jgi:two-component system NtrC family sensor kinase
MPPVDSFQAVLLELSSAASKGIEFREMVDLFCRVVREHFQVSSVSCWLLQGKEMFGIAGAGTHLEHHRGRRISVDSENYSAKAVRNNVIVLVNDVPAQPDELARQTLVESILALPLMVNGRVSGAIVLAHDTRKRFFSDDLVAKCQILASILGSLIETARLTRESHEEHRRAECLMNCAQALHARLETKSICNVLAQSVCDLLQAQATLLLVQTGDEFEIGAIHSPNPGIISSIRNHQRPGICQAVRRMALGAIEKREPVAADLQEIGEFPPDGLSPGKVLIAPLFPDTSPAVLLIYPGEARGFNSAEVSLVRAIAHFGSMAISNAEWFAKSGAQAREMQQLLAITSELSSANDLDKFLERFVLRTAEFLGFQNSCIGLNEADGNCSVRWAAIDGEARPFVCEIPPRILKTVVADKKVFWIDDAFSLPDVKIELAAKHNIRQVLATPLLGSEGQSLGVLAALDRKDGKPITQEDVRRAEALAAAVATVLERTRNLFLAVQHQRRAEDLVRLALEVGSSIRLPDLVRSLTTRAAAMMGAQSAALLLARGSSLETVYMSNGPDLEDKSLARRLNLGMTELLLQRGDQIRYGAAAELLGPSLAQALGWHNIAIVRMASGDQEMVGVLCLANLPRELSLDDRSVLKAITAHAAVALDNARLFSRIAQANSQWVEIFDAITDLIVLHDHTDRVLRVNRSMADFIGVRPAELVGVTMRALMALAHEPGPEPCPFCRAGAEPTDEYVHPVLDRTYLVSTSQIHGTLDEGRQTIHVLKDITDRREAERRYRELLDNIQEGLFFSTTDGRFVEVNDALVRMLGYGSREELLQVDIYQELYDTREERRRFQDSVEATGVLRNYEEVLRKKDGSKIYTLQNAFAVRDAHGNVTQYRGLMLDITELKNFQSELQRQRDFNASILNNTQSLIFVSDTAGLISFANQRCYELGGFQAGDLVGHPLVELVSPERRDILRNALERALEGEQVGNVEVPVMLAESRVGQYSVNLSPMRDEKGHVNSIVVVMSDITDAAILQAKLMHTEKMAAVGQLVSGVAHEVNNPLTAILGFADLLSEQPGIPEDAKRDLGVIIQEAQRTKQIVQNLLSFARQMPPQRQAVDVNAILRRTVQLRAYDFANHGIKLALELQEPMPEVTGDPHQLQQVFLNILNNAYDAVRESTEPGSVEVTSSERAGFAEIMFTDSGNGIAAPERIFDPFYTTKEVGKGTGLGLSICYGIVREHGGDIYAANRADVSGAVFTVRLPLATAKSPVEAGGKAN